MWKYIYFDTRNTLCYVTCANHHLKHFHMRKPSTSILSTLSSFLKSSPRPKALVSGFPHEIRHVYALQACILERRKLRHTQYSMLRHMKRLTCVRRNSSHTRRRVPSSSISSSLSLSLASSPLAAASDFGSTLRNGCGAERGRTMLVKCVGASDNTGRAYGVRPHITSPNLTKSLELKNVTEREKRKREGEHRK